MSIYLRTNITGSGIEAALWTNQLTPEDLIAPVLSSATGAKLGRFTATGTVSTDEGNGLLHYIATTNPTESAATIIAGSTNKPVISTGVQTVSIGGLTQDTTYYMHYVHVDSANNVSDVISSSSFTTDPYAGGGYSSWEQWLESLDNGSTTTKIRNFLTNKGYVGSTTTMMYEYLKTVSVKGSHQERKQDWEDGGWN